MAQNIRSRRIGLLGASLISASAMIGVPASAQAGFFDQLFGGSASPEPSVQANEPQLDVPSQPMVLQRRHAVKKVAVDDKPVLQKTTDLMHDKTLLPGDAVMMKTGIKIYTGRDSVTHRRADFTSLDNARQVSPATKTVLASMDATRNDPLAKAANPDTLASGRSASVSAPIVAGIKFTDQRGVTIRYVGP